MATKTTETAETGETESMTGLCESGDRIRVVVQQCPRRERLATALSAPFPSGNPAEGEGWLVEAQVDGHPFSANFPVESVVSVVETAQERAGE